MSGKPLIRQKDRLAEETQATMGDEPEMKNDP
jgi:hypothetical protein